MQTRAKGHTARATTQRPVMQTFQKTLGGSRGKLSVLTWFRSCRLGSGCPSVGLSCFVFCPVTGVCLFLLGRQPEDWPFTGFLHCQRLCESGSRRLCRTIGAGTPCTDIPSKNLARAASQGFHSGVHGPVCTGAPRLQRHGERRFATENLQMLCIRARGISPHMCQLRLHHIPWHVFHPIL